MKNILIVLLIILLNSINSQYLLSKELKFNRLTAENGLPYSTANVMLQDDNGFYGLALIQDCAAMMELIQKFIQNSKISRCGLWPRRMETGYG